MNNQLLKQILKPIFLLTALVIICAFLIRSLTDSETLSDYAAKNPELAYGTVNENIDDNELGNDGETMSMEENNQAAVSETQVASEPTPDKEPLPDTNIEKEQGEAQAPSPDRITYQEGFYYESLTEPVKEKITGISYPVSASDASVSSVHVLNMLEADAEPAISYDDLRYLCILYYDFNGEVQTGELICNQGIAQDLAEIFYELYQNEYQIEKIRLIEEYQGDDIASMLDNNTSCFNYRVVDGTTSLSKHALGCAIDINPFYNPYIVFNKDGSGETYISPAGSEIYADRSKDFPYKIDENDLCYKLFKEHGFIWGGDWNSLKDYQHFQKAVE